MFHLKDKKNIVEFFSLPLIDMVEILATPLFACNLFTEKNYRETKIVTLTSQKTCMLAQPSGRHPIRHGMFQAWHLCSYFVLQAPLFSNLPLEVGRTARPTNQHTQTIIVKQRSIKATNIFLTFIVAIRILIKG